MSPESFSLPEAKFGAVTQAARPQPRAEFLNYLSCVAAAGALVLADALHCPDGSVPTAGLFPVPKAADVDRGITDRRPANAYEELLEFPTLPHGTQFGNIILHRHQALRFAHVIFLNIFRSLVCP